MSEYELPTDTKLRDMLQAKYGKPNHDVLIDGGEYGKGFVKGYNLGYDDGSRHAWEEMTQILNHVMKHFTGDKNG
jgi:hypothetical protein